MLIVVLLLALCFYVWMYWIWDSAELPINGAVSVMGRFDRMLFMPETTIFTIMHGLILITLFYVLCDFLYSSARNGIRKMKTGAACPVKYPVEGASCTVHYNRH